MERRVRIIQVIETTLEVRGTGEAGDPFRLVTQFWSLDGRLLAENDPLVTGRGERITLAPEGDGERK